MKFVICVTRHIIKQDRTIVRVTSRRIAPESWPLMATLFEVTLTGTYFGQETISRWNYVESGTPAAVSRSFGLVFAFGGIAVDGTYPEDTVLSALSNLCIADWTWQQITALAVYDPEDFYQTPFVPEYGGSVLTNPGLSPAVAFGFRSNQVRRDVRRAYKRFPGVGENDQELGGQIVSGTRTLMDAVAAVMGEAITYDDEGTPLTYTPAVVSKQRYNPATGEADPEGTAYRYIPEADGGEAAQLLKTAQGITWEKYTNTRTQVSRQYGRGR